MTHKALIRKTKAAQRRVDVTVRRLHALSGKPQLTEAEKSLLPMMRKASHQAIQYCSRLNRRKAKLSGAPHLPKLMRSSFRMTAEFKRINSMRGQEAAQAVLLLHLAGIKDSEYTPVAVGQGA